MSGIGNPDLELHDTIGNDHKLSRGPQRFSRSPHPYALRSQETLHDAQETLDGSNPRTRPSVASLQPNPARVQSRFFDVDSRKRRKDSSSPSESGTEADDESGPFLRGLPAPPARLRKGLKNETAQGTPSPLLTPSYLDDEKRRQVVEARLKRRASLQSNTSTDEETLSIRAKFENRRRAELLRRTTEAILLFGVGGLACRKILLLPVRKELAVSTLVVCGTYLLYPLRLYFHHGMLPEGARESRPFLRIPAAFDPATLLYPVLLPVFVAASLQSQNEAYVLVNAILGIAAMPRTIVPSQDSFSGHTPVQYLLSILPLAFLGNNTAEPVSTRVYAAADPEFLSLLYPLHQALLPCLGYLTTTSLLPAELQLLSISLINLLLLGSSPQSLILKALLWIGALLLFTLCRRVLEWEVALARIPSWRFRRNNDYNSSYLSLKRILKKLLKRRPYYSTVAEDTYDESDRDEPPKIARRPPRTRPQSVSSATNQYSSTFGKLKRTTTLPPIDDTKSQWAMKADGTSSPTPEEARRQRSSTLPSFTGPLSERFSQSKAGKVPGTILFPVPQSFRSLTKEQATVLKWIYALYTYAVAIAVIVIPIRFYVGTYALHGQEPVGWALGYLLGDIHRFRDIVTTTGLQQWIRIPSHDFSSAFSYGWAESVRWRYLGAANTRLLICLHCLCTICLGLALVLQLSKLADVDTRRKVFHGMMVVMFLPTIFVDPTFVALALSLVLAIFLLLDLFRASQLPPLSRPLTYFLAPYVDGRDHRGPVIVSHIFLLVGCSIPLWLSLAAMERSGQFPWQGWEVPRRNLSMISGVVCVGMGDAAASLIGRRYGQRRWCWSGGKSLEGSAAFVVAVLAGLSMARLWLVYGGWHGSGGESWPVFVGKATVAACGASLTEAVLTGGNDNVIVPVILWLLVRGVAL
ncbi:MAG: hypothetical protein LQ348_000601 [Seirophora lacunosa]|nr:MAG: hypothetical protein LQ344_003009 [Seirophora lacunosa]KAI4207327.1 MAG: hypothetical protein LQ348_000601 [Seirophora lacunosa]